MAFVNFSLLFGGLLVAVPVVLHLIVRARPRQLVFPALRFLQVRREANRRRLQLRHWLLLALRCALIGVLALALARPSVSSASLGNWGVISLLGMLSVVVLSLLVVTLAQRRGKFVVVGLGATACGILVALGIVVAGTLSGSSGIRLVDREAPLAAVLLFDTAPRMEYRYQNKTRLEASQEIALWLIRQFPPDSQVGVLDSRPGRAVFAVDLAAAKKAVERLRTTGIPDTLPEVLERALSLVLTSQHAGKEIYVLSDLSAASWPPNSQNALASQLSRSPEVSLYVVDVGARDPRNFGLGVVSLSAQTLTKSGELVLETDLRATGAGGVKEVELCVEEPDSQRPVIVDGRPLLPATQRRDRRQVTVPENGAQQVVFRLRGLPPGVHQGFVRTNGGDGLPVDDIRYFAVDVREAWPVLVLAPRDVHTALFTEAIAPTEFQQTDRARFACNVVSQSELANQSFADYRVVCLLDPEPVPPSAWEQCAQYVERGGCLAVFLGHHAQPVAAFATDTARRLLGGTLARQWRVAAGRELFLAPQEYEHPVLAPFRQQPTSVPWNQSPVFRHWVLEKLGPDARVVIPYTNGEAALVENGLGKGRVLTMTTPVTDPSRPPGRAAWNELPTSDDAWPCFVLVNEMLLYLAGAGESQVNYVAGETAVLPNDSERDPERYQLFTPLEEPQEITANGSQVIVRFTERPGAYRLKGHRGGPVLRGFAVNLPAEATELTRVPNGRLAELLGADRYQLAGSREEIVREVGEARVGREFYPFLIAALALLLGLELLLANRFYRRSEATYDEGARQRDGHHPPLAEVDATMVRT